MDGDGWVNLGMLLTPAIAVGVPLLAAFIRWRGETVRLEERVRGHVDDRGAHVGVELRERIVEMYTRLEAVQERQGEQREFLLTFQRSVEKRLDDLIRMNGGRRRAEEGPGS